MPYVTVRSDEREKELFKPLPPLAPCHACGRENPDVESFDWESINVDRIICPRCKLSSSFGMGMSASGTYAAWNRCEVIKRDGGVSIFEEILREKGTFCNAY